MTPEVTHAASPPMIPLPKSPAAATAILVAMIGIPTFAIAAWEPHPVEAHAAHHAQTAPALAPDTARVNDASASHVRRDTTSDLQR